MKIITIPHPTLRKKSQPVIEANQQLVEFVEQLQATLDQTRQPRGVGLAAPQLNQLWRIFATHLPPKKELRSTKESRSTGAGYPGQRPTRQLRYFINPVITRACKRKKVLGVKPQDPDLEGCLSMPGLYGPVPRHRWVEVEYQTLTDEQLVKRQERFNDFAARVVQHEIDHLDGVLFTDYALENELPVYRQSDDGQSLVEIEPELIRVI